MISVYVVAGISARGGHGTCGRVVHSWEASCPFAIMAIGSLSRVVDEEDSAGVIIGECRGVQSVILREASGHMYTEV